MNQIIIASNRIPVLVEKQGDNFVLSEAGRSTVYDLPEYSKKIKTRWIGLTGIDGHQFSEEEKRQLTLRLEEYRSIPLFPDTETSKRAFHGYAKNTLWPLFHYFPQNATYNDYYLHAYRSINEMYADYICEIAAPGDTVWIHDYHLLLLPGLLKERCPDLSVGLFIHIPFPSFEIFRLLPSREEILDGMLSADLLGFNAYDYVRHLLSCVRRIKGYDTVFNRISIGERTMLVDVFPKGLHFEMFTSEVRRLHDLHKKGGTSMQGALIDRFRRDKTSKVIISIDPLDYTKGIPQRLLGFELFLKENPVYLEKVTLVLAAMPSGESSKSHRSLKRNVDEMVGRINGTYGTITWSPVIYLNQKFSENELIDIYAYSDIALIIPLRDGMNMVAKEFVASRLDGRGVLILSEMAGASKELHEAILVNPNNLAEVASAIKSALEMPDCEQIRRNDVMTERLRRYTLSRWAEEFLGRLSEVKELQKSNLTRKIDSKRLERILSDYRDSKRRILFLDYDGTLSWFRKDPEEAKPDNELKEIILNLTDDPANRVVIISGRDKETLERWFKEYSKLEFVAEHGVWVKDPGNRWSMMEQLDNEWKNSVYPILEYYVDQTPNTFIEEKNFSLVWHYRKADPDLGIQRSWELKDQLRILTANLNLEIMDGDKVIEIKNSGINKGRAALSRIGSIEYDFIFAVGDDWTDEYTFRALPTSSYTVKVGTKTTSAAYYIESVDKVRTLLKRFATEHP